MSMIFFLWCTSTRWASISLKASVERIANAISKYIPPIIIKGIKINSKEIEKGDLFVCTMGATADRHDFIDEAIKNEYRFV